MPKPIIYMLRETVGVMRANDPRVVQAFELVGFRRCTREEYQAMKRRLMREEAEQHNNERGASTND